MKRMTKIALWCGGALITGGLILCFCAMLLVQFDIMKLDPMPEYTAKSYTREIVDFAQIYTETKNTPIIVKPSKDEQMHITYYENKYETYTISDSNPVFEMEYQNTKKWYQYISFSFLNGISSLQNQMIIELPSTYKEGLQLVTSNNTITISDFPSLGDVAGTTSNGAITVSNVNTNHLTGKTTNAAIRFEDVAVIDKLHAVTTNAPLTFKNLSAHTIYSETSNSSISFNQLSADGRIEASASNASITLTDTHAQDLICDTSNAKITSTRSDAVKLVDFNTSNGAITFDTFSSDDINLKTSNSPISGMVAGALSEYSIVTKTSNADNSLMNKPNGNKKLSVVTSNGKIDVAFIQ